MVQASPSAARRAPSDQPTAARLNRSLRGGTSIGGDAQQDQRGVVGEPEVPSAHTEDLRPTPTRPAYSKAVLDAVVDGHDLARCSPASAGACMETGLGEDQEPGGRRRQASAAVKTRSQQCFHSQRKSSRNQQSARGRQLTRRGLLCTRWRMAALRPHFGSSTSASFSESRHRLAKCRASDLVKKWIAVD